MVESLSPVAKLTAPIARPAGLVPEMAGPRIYPMGDLLRAYLRASGKHRLIVPVPMPGEAAAAVRAGALLSPEGAVGHRTWEDFLAERLSASATSRSVVA